ncbi:MULTISPECIES: molybdate ABC transporter permease subunit [unclassified Moorena]|uniref:molybdate ABC transporter permease subunit n=1 Tax=unclassified Moorena TaxID=2683338 RepID=UPI0013CA0F50|nr:MULTISPECIES: molybdate ABC transporter permease subunit [unclassified Moorena]NEO18942.1 molybdate ABC transporter permease subunit [Moorena sp. SIO4A5]NEQ56145.1 molybdate ABC transporter permease subunit [Moorena sp. SIO4A1]
MEDLSPLWISLKTAGLATIFAFFLGITVAGWMFSYQGKAKGIIDSILTLPIVLPPTVVGFLLLLLLGRNSPVGQLLRQLGLSVILSWPATVIAATVVAFPLMYKTVLGAFKQVNQDLINCARTLGASECRVFWQVLLPLAWPGVMAGTVLAFARALGEFGATLMLAGSIPGRTQTIAIAIFFAAQAGRMGEALLWVLIMVAIALVAITIINYEQGAGNREQGAGSREQGAGTKSNIEVSKGSPLTPLIKGGTRASLIKGGKEQGIGKKSNIEVRKGSPLTPLNKGGTRAFLNQGGKEQGTGKKSNIEPSQGLLVELRKEVSSSFTLDAKFTANGKPLGILGASGSGKSMTLRCIAGLATPTQGRIVLNGRVLFDSKQGINLPPHQRRIGFVFQNYALFPHMNVAQNIGFGLQELPKAQRNERVWKYIELMHLQGLEKRYPHELSGGQQQRVALARAMAIAPEALLLDEPLSALDTYLRNQIERLLTEIFSTYQGATLFVTHKLEEAYRVCGNLLVLSEGKVIASGSKEAIFEHPPSFRVAQLTECKNFSRVEIIEDQKIQALDWNCSLSVVEPITKSLAYVGIRAHHLIFLNEPNHDNTFPCWLVTMSETQHRVTLYLSLYTASRNPQQYHLQAEVFKEKWHQIKAWPEPWYVQLDALRLILMES